MALATEYALASGHDVALAGLTAVQTALYANNRRTPTGARYQVGVTSQPVDAYPVREIALSGVERGDGMVFHEWSLVLATYGVKYLLDTWLSSAAVVSAAVTINTRRHWLADFARYNAYLVLPKPNEDITYIRQNVFRVRLRFNALEAL